MGGSESDAPESAGSAPSWRSYVTVFILCFYSLLYCMDHVGPSGLLTQIQCDFQASDGQIGSVQSVFVFSYILVAPFIGYFADRKSRRWILAVGIFVWSVAMLISTLMENFTWFLVLRALDGVGEATYAAITPAIISDLFTGNQRSRMLTVFYFTFPVGGGLGYVLESEVAKALGTWRWGMRITPLAGIVCALVIAVFVRDPPRGQSEGSTLEPTSIQEDLKYLGTNRSYVIGSIATVCSSFSIGAVSSWFPYYMTYGLSKDDPDADVSSVASVFGLVVILAGMVGIVAGAALSQRLRRRFQTSDPLICSVGLLTSAPLFYVCLLLVDRSAVATYVLLFFGEILLFMNLVVAGDIILYVLVPTRRSIGKSLQILGTHLLGDAGSPFIIGQVYEAIKNSLAPSGKYVGEPEFHRFTPAPFSDADSGGRNCTAGPSDDTDVARNFTALQYALFIFLFVEVFGAFCFMALSFTVVKDKAQIDQAIAGAKTAS